MWLAHPCEVVVGPGKDSCGKRALYAGAEYCGEIWSSSGGGGPAPNYLEKVYVDSECNAVNALCGHLADAGGSIPESPTKGSTYGGTVDSWWEDDVYVEYEESGDLWVMEIWDGETLQVWAGHYSDETERTVLTAEEEKARQTKAYNELMEKWRKDLEAELRGEKTDNTPVYVPDDDEGEKKDDSNPSTPSPYDPTPKPPE
jgi:hypothetical protein